MARTFTGPGNVGRVSDAKNGGSALVMSGASQAAAPANAARAAMYLSNNGAAAMFLAFGTAATPTPTAVATSGLRLAPGATVVLEAFTGAVAVIGTAADVLGIVEL